MHLSVIIYICLCIISVQADDQSVISFKAKYVSIAIDDNQTANAQLVNTNVPYPVTIEFLYDNKTNNERGYIETIPNITYDSSDSASKDFYIVGRREGHLTLTVQSSEVNVSGNVDYILIDVARSNGLNILIQIVGWIYFAAWSVSFYPQIYTNFRRRSVVGLNFDFLALNLLGHSCYTVFNLSMYASTDIQNQYHVRYPHGVLPVLLNDVIFSVHAVFATVVTVIQCLIYERGRQRVSYVARLIAGVMIVFLFISSIVSFSSHLSTLELLYFFSYVKLAITIIKYCPQAYMNYRRKSTEGWSIGNILLDFTGGLLSLVQMFLLSSNYNDWTSIFGSPTKLGLGLFSIFFDVIFILQHYVCYRNHGDYENDESRLNSDDEDRSLFYSKS